MRRTPASSVPDQVRTPRAAAGCKEPNRRNVLRKQAGEERGSTNRRWRTALEKRRINGEFREDREAWTELPFTTQPTNFLANSGNNTILEEIGRRGERDRGKGGGNYIGLGIESKGEHAIRTLPTGQKILLSRTYLTSCRLRRSTFAGFQ